jgi:DNA-binding transcriptional regulator YdaS (Cro superfamily)
MFARAVWLYIHWFCNPFARRSTERVTRGDRQSAALRFRNEWSEWADTQCSSRVNSDHKSNDRRGHPSGGNFE